VGAPGNVGSKNSPLHEEEEEESYNFLTASGGSIDRVTKDLSLYKIPKDQIFFFYVCLRIQEPQ
jgi:hypothetical protein